MPAFESLSACGLTFAREGGENAYYNDVQWEILR